jgi:hypothetical protein
MISVSRSTGVAASLSVHSAELMAIKEACSIVNALWPVDGIYPCLTMTLFLDRRSRCKKEMVQGPEVGQRVEMVDQRHPLPM